MPVKRDKSPKRHKRQINLEVLRVVMANGAISFRDLCNLYQTSKKIQRQFVNFDVYFDGYGFIHISQYQTWKDLFKAQGRRVDLDKRATFEDCSQMGRLLRCLMYVDLQDTAMMIIQHFDIPWKTHCFLAMTLNGTLSAYTALKKRVPEDDLWYFDNQLGENAFVFYVSSELYKKFHGMCSISQLIRLFIQSVRCKSVVAFEYCIENFKTEYYRDPPTCWGDVVRKDNFISSDDFSELVSMWSYASTHEVIKWLTTDDTRTYLEAYNSCREITPITNKIAT